MKKICVLLTIVVTFLSTTFAYYDLEDSEIVHPDEIVEVVNSNVKKPKIQAKAAILYDRTCKRVLFSKNIDEKVPNASTTKILTAIVAYEHGNLKDIITVSKLAANTGGSKVKFREGDKISLNDLMHGLLLCSGNDAAVAIAEHIARKC